MKKRLFMIIAIMTIVAMAVVGLVACDGDNNNGGGNSGGENNGGGNAEETPITETAGLNINNLRTELEKKTFTLKVEEKEITDGNTEILAYKEEYEPTKSKRTYIVDGIERSTSQYLYQLGNKYIVVGTDLSVRVASFNDGLVDLTMFIAPNAEDLFEKKDGKYSIKIDKYEDYYKKLSNDEELPDEEMWNTYKQIFASMRIEFKADSISINFEYEKGSTEVQNSYNFTKIGSTTVTIPQEILDLPVHGISINNINKLNTISYTASIKTDRDGEISERIVEYTYAQNESRLSSYVKGNDDKLYIWQESGTKFYMAQQNSEGIVKSEAPSNLLFDVVDMIEDIVKYDYFELINGKYIVKESEIENYFKSDMKNLMTLFKGDMDAIRAYIKSIELNIGKEITLTYEQTRNGSTKKETITLNNFITTNVNIPDSIINMPVTEEE